LYGTDCIKKEKYVVWRETDGPLHSNDERGYGQQCEFMGNTYRWKDTEIYKDKQQSDLISSFLFYKNKRSELEVGVI
jgi:hypothetical protein